MVHEAARRQCFGTDCDNDTGDLTALVPAPEWAASGVPKAGQRLNRSKIAVLNLAGQEAMHKVSRSVCASPNEVACYGIPDQRELEDGDIINLNVSLYHAGHHTDLNETYYVGKKARANPDAICVVGTAKECLDLAIKLVKPGCLFREFDVAIEKHAKSRGHSVVAIWGGHGINTELDPPPWIPHYGKNRAPKEIHWPDQWTNVTLGGEWAAQFEDTLLVTETGVEVLTARLASSPGGAIRESSTKTAETNGAAKV
ncbi:hypothetical protein KC316_g953 [Hortaea werneckii]|nr:hypothetical protein KC324_g1041 [Hortaea werneckii]KAI7594723.1 hypothetical protein KC316_g953 [Hortaea werneckii]